MNTKLAATLLSILFHLFLIVGPIYYHYQINQSSKWSGGNNSQITYINLKKIDVIATEKKGQKKIKNPKVKKSQLKLKQKLKQNNLSKKTQQQKTSKKSSSGIGKSITPAGGTGSGLDHKGIIAKQAPNILAKIRKKIMRKKTYPKLAKENEWIGTTKVSFKINQDGSLNFVRVTQSSGHQILDKAAKSSIFKAAPLPYYPKTISLKLEYQLQ
ncbi:hypothetical protein BVY03_02850 [bacterium K02(2017)]|nr:hypothetical protein BVY03_02850 [bacterium K02(2017)]